MWRVAVVGLTLVALALRVFELSAVPLRWDEGWSVAMAALTVRQMLSITALDVHPPLYYLLLSGWQGAVGASEFLARYPSVLAGTVAVPLAAVAARAAWPGRSGLWGGIVAAAYVAVAPLLVYYSGVARMYALTTPFILLVAWGVGRSVLRPELRHMAPEMAHRTRLRGMARPGPWLAMVTGCLGALYTSYYAGIAAGVLIACAVLLRPRRAVGPLLAGLVAGMYFAPWAMTMLDSLSERIAERTADGMATSATPALLWEGMKGATLAQDNPLPAVLPLLVIGAGIVAAQVRGARFALAVVPAAAVLLAVAVGTQAHMFAPRYVAPATPLLALGIGLAAARFWELHRLAGAALAVLAVLPAAAGLTPALYQRALEVTDPYDPRADARALADTREGEDLAVFNILSLAGFYEAYRTPGTADWSFAQTWDPVHEPLSDARARISAGASEHRRLWLVLYQGTYAEDTAAIKAWADETFFPAASHWEADRLYQSYLVAVPDKGVDAAADFGHGVVLKDATFTSTAAPGDGLAIYLRWSARRRPDADGKVFVHLYDQAGDLVAQNDGFPAFDTRPQRSWAAGEDIYDRRGILLPADAPSGRLTLAVGIYDPDSGQRWTLGNGEDHVVLGQVTVSDGRLR